MLICIFRAQKRWYVILLEPHELSMMHASMALSDAGNLKIVVVLQAVTEIPFIVYKDFRSYLFKNDTILDSVKFLRLKKLLPLILVPIID